MTGAASSVQQPERADLSAWLAVAAGTLGAFMAVLDTSIVSASLPTIQGEIGATPAEGTWVGTAYLAAEVIVIPLTVWLERLLGLRRLLLISTALFTLFSVLCGLSGTLFAIVAGRLGQGLTGGVLIPTAFTIIARRLPPSQQSIGISIFGGAALLGPILGPVVGGYITESFSWHFAFFINLPIGIALFALLMISLPPAAGDSNELHQADWLGIGGIALGLGALTILLEEGHREDWYASSLIWQLTIAALAGFLLVAIGQFRAREPVIRLSLLRNPVLASTIGLMTVIGALQFGMTFVVPQFLAALAGYNALQAGEVMFASGLASALMMPLYPTLLAQRDPRITVAIGVVLIAFAGFASSHLTAAATGATFMIPLLMLGTGTAFAGMPLQQGSIAAVRLEDAAAASALFMVSRNLGGSIGLAAVGSFQDARLEFHHWRLHETIGANAPMVQQELAERAAGLGGGWQGLDAAYRALDADVLREALVMSFNDIFLSLGVVTMATLPLCLLLRRFTPGAGGGAMH